MTKSTFIRFTTTGVWAAMLANLLAGSLCAPSWAGGGYHPRRAEVMGRDRNLSRQINRNYGDLGGHYGQLQREDAAIRRQERTDFRQNGGYLTRGEKQQLNGEENALRSQIRSDKGLGHPGPSDFREDHPRRAEVLGRDTRIGGRLNADYGKLDGNFGALKQDQRSIRQQEQADAAANGGYITRTQKQQLNQEENQLNQQIRQDLSQ